ncbi:hypothetical protein Zmor_027752 [Zophobas morio]|uniref:Thioesterase domain-containing protein n=1 Tax=Zophobas morio TaxID=2755281 RepID=A0AA38HRA0_9CUCU|nr:hypothetical protein Zmor_027752 [Zophobas morio]
MAQKKLDLAALTGFLDKCEGFEKIFKEKMVVQELGDGKCIAELKVDKSFLNPLGGLHGGVSATLVDCISTYALMSQTGVPGVSVDIHLTYLKGARLDDVVVVEGRVEKVGKTLAFVEAEIKHKATGEVLVKGLHTKFVAA